MQLNRTLENGGVICKSITHSHDIRIWGESGKNTLMSKHMYWLCQKEKIQKGEAKHGTQKWSN